MPAVRMVTFDPGVPDHVQSKSRQLAVKLPVEFTLVNRWKHRRSLSPSVIRVRGRLLNLLSARTIQNGARTPAGVLATVDHHAAIH